MTATPGGDFSHALTPEQIRASGLAKLSPGELATLTTIVEQYKAGTLAPAPSPAEAQPPTPAAKPASKPPSWFSNLVTREKASSQHDKPDEMESRLAGDFKGWNGQTTFRFENGQVWKQAEHDIYAQAAVLNSPKVKVYPASFGTYWLEIDGVYPRCRVLPVKLQ